MIDITIARITHVEWEYQLELALQKRNLVINMRPYNECELGIWLYSTALKMYQEIPEIELLENEHKLFHMAADKVVKWHNSPKISPRYDAQAQIDFEEVQQKSKEIIYLLTMLEFKMLMKYQHDSSDQLLDFKSIIKNPLKTLTNMVKGKDKIHNVSQTSLDMLKADLIKKGLK
ncbi:MAG: CZB domain-containing protein [Nitrospirae bacterium]|uniref:CZB domain-containing protein n=1 Tax=Candidatus Magnetobacterium casense TaxID=1455061 RepID=UPI000590370C|nr:CZB domain-containing protein [Candidatus Magnetobacterium casensis]MBF0338183.1 CZB domain-containing protein [Nitrospirota bacterium]